MASFQFQRTQYRYYYLINLFWCFSEEEADDTPPSDVNLEDCLSAFFQTDQVLNEKNLSIEK